MAVLVIDLNEAEATKLPASLEPLAGLADTVQAAGIGTKPTSDNSPEPAIPEVWQVVLHYGNEEEQHGVYDRLTDQGLPRAGDVNV
ncbi:MAG: hypothetical protein J5I93_02200 [Pirellulaceae bacterium]|nr:hypothetical protein [Pirellulaceae bacterium]